MSVIAIVICILLFLSCHYSFLARLFFEYKSQSIEITMVSVTLAAAVLMSVTQAFWNFKH